MTRPDETQAETPLIQATPSLPKTRPTRAKKLVRGADAAETLQSTSETLRKPSAHLKNRPPEFGQTENLTNRDNRDTVVPTKDGISPRRIFVSETPSSGPKLSDAATLRGAATAFRKRVDAVLAPLIAEVGPWLSSLEGRKFPVESAKEEIAAIVEIVRMANRQLMYRGKPVTLYSGPGNSRLRHAQVKIITIKASPKKQLYSGTTLPRLEVV